MKFTRSRTVIVGAVIALLGLPAAAGPVLGQGSAPPSAGTTVAHPAFVSQGTCADPGAEARFSLGDVPVAPALVPSFGPTVEREPVDADELDVPLAELLAEPHAVLVRGSAEDPETTVACGDIGGTVVGGVLSVGLAEQHGSGYAGVARLLRDDDRTLVNAFLTEGLAGTASAVIEAPDLSVGCGCGPSGPTDASAASVTMVDFLFLPSLLQVESGTAVTWVNDGPGDHTATVFRDGELVADSGVLAAGRSFVHVFGEPGNYQYVSTLDPVMRAWIVVVPSAAGAA